jgi:hypothetical protein
VPLATTPAWSGFGGDAQHTAVAPASPQPLTRIRWKAKVDLAPVLVDNELTIHYGSPMITKANTVVVPTRISATGGFEVEAYAGATGAHVWTLATDYTAPVNADFSWTPPLPASLTAGNALAVAGAGGTVIFRSNANSATGASRRVAFYGTSRWAAHRSAYDSAVQITTPLTAAADGSVYFGFSVNGSTPTPLRSGIARIDAHGHGSWVSAATAAGEPGGATVALNSAPALSPDGSVLYEAVNGSTGVLVSLAATTLQPKAHVTLIDPVSGQPSRLSPDSSASPTVGPDGDVYFGVLETPALSHDDRGWLLHFNAGLTLQKITGSFGWDSTVSLIPASSVPSYTGSSPYLVVSKYNNYDGLGPHGDGHNQVALLDPRTSQTDPYASVQTMKPVETVLSPLQFPGGAPGAKYEWCINSAVVDPVTGSVIANSEAGVLYRWDLVHRKLAESIRLNAPRPEAYTPTVIGPDGTVYAINDSTLYAIGS